MPLPRYYNCNYNIHQYYTYKSIVFGIIICAIIMCQCILCSRIFSNVGTRQDTLLTPHLSKLIPIRRMKLPMGKRRPFANYVLTREIIGFRGGQTAALV